MESVGLAFKSLAAEPVAILMALVAVGCMLFAVAFGVRFRDRLLLVVLGLMSGTAAWVMASSWRWPWPK
jgi:hypothetical protein